MSVNICNINLSITSLNNKLNKSDFSSEIIIRNKNKNKQ